MGIGYGPGIGGNSDWRRRQSRHRRHQQQARARTVFSPPLSYHTGRQRPTAPWSKALEANIRARKSRQAAPGPTSAHSPMYMGDRSRGRQRLYKRAGYHDPDARIPRTGVRPDPVRPELRDLRANMVQRNDWFQEGRAGVMPASQKHGSPSGYNRGGGWSRKHRILGRTTGTVGGFALAGGIATAGLMGMGFDPMQAATGGAALGMLGAAAGFEMPTGLQALSFGAAGGALGYAMGGSTGGLVGAMAGGALGAIGPIHGTKMLWRSGTAGKAAILGTGALGATALGASMISGGIDADSALGMAGGVASASAMSLPLLGVAGSALPGKMRTAGMMGGGAALGAGIGSVAGPVGTVVGGLAGAAAGGAGGVGWGMYSAAKAGKKGLQAVGAKGFGKTGDIIGSTMRFTGKYPGVAGGLLGAALGGASIVGGLVDMMSTPDAPVGSMAMGNRESLYGMDANNLDTQALTLALHYKHQ